jgi:putative acetyltransferase
VALSIEQAREATPEVRQLIEELEQVLAGSYNDDQRHGLSLDQLFRPNVHFFIARLDGIAVGCGGVEISDGYAEVKRVYARPAVRGLGVAKALMAQVEKEARDAGVRSLRLETGTEQKAAIGLYERLGFRSCGPFGAYAVMPANAIAQSLFFGKDL